MRLFCFLLLAFGSWHCQPLPCNTAPHPKVRGISFVAPPRPFSTDPMPAIKAIHADWIAVIPYAFIPKDAPKVRYNAWQGQWWGERPKGIRRTIQLAHAAGLKVMLKPQLWIQGGAWVGDLDYATDAEWEAWEEGFRAYLLLMAQIAEEEGVALLCIGTELKQHAVQRSTFWRALAADIRQQYSGPLTYAANWDNYQNIPFWDALDYVGINAYFPLHPADTPSVHRLQQAWQPTVRSLRRFHCRVQRPILFTEWGYLSVNGAAFNTWALEAQLDRLSANADAQAHAVEALLSTFEGEPWWAGGFYWKWYPNGQYDTRQHEKDYSPQGKIAQEVLSRWYARPDSLQWPHPLPKLR